MAGDPTAQLVSLCTGYGALPSRIPTVAPFLRDLPATQHAQQVLFSDGTTGWQHAARELLICVTKPGGAARFDERTARFVRACLGINGALESYTQRMNDLSNDPDFSFWKSRNTLDKQRDEMMDILAGKLLQLASYPCDPGRVESALEEFLDLANVVKTRHLEHLDRAELNAFYDRAFRRLTAAVAFFDHRDPDLSPERRLSIMVTAVAARPYRQLYELLKPRSIDLLVPPDEVWKLYEGRPSLFDPESPETERTMRLVERIILDIEERDAWENTLLAKATAEEEGGLTQAQTLRLRAVFERLTDQS